MKTYAIFTPATGQILRMVDCPETMIEAQLGAGEAAMPAGPDISDATHYVMGGFHPIPAQPSPHHVWDWGSKEWREPVDLGPARAAKWAEIKAARDAEENGASVFEWDGSAFDSSPVRIGGAFSAARAALELGIPFSVDWTLADNTVRTLSATEMVEVGFAQLAHVEALHTKARQLRAQIYAATSLAEIEAVTWQWP